MSEIVDTKERRDNMGEVYRETVIDDVLSGKLLLRPVHLIVNGCQVCLVAETAVGGGDVEEQLDDGWRLLGEHMQAARDWYATSVKPDTVAEPCAP